MSKQTINIGASPNDGTGTPLRTSFDYTNQNFTELYTAVGPSGNNIVVPGNATITGDLTVDTSTLKVDSTNNRVGIGTASPGAGYVLDVVGAARITAANGLVIDKAGAGFVDFFNSGNSGANVGTSGTGGLTIYTANGIGGSYGVRYVIDSTGISTWSVAGTTAMTLNSTGLGIGASPATKLDVRGANNASQATFSGTAGRGLLISTRSDSLADDRTVILNAQHSTGSLGQLVIQTVGTDRLLVDSTGNVGIGVTPSAWATSGNYVALQVGGIGLYGRNAAGNELDISSNGFYSSTGWKYITTASATRYAQQTGVHAWHTAASGTAGNAITFTQAMTLDASGNLLVGTTDAGSNSGIGLKVAYSATAPYFSTVGSSTSASEYSYLLYSTGGTPAFKFYVSYSGQISATSGTVAALSDARFKENIQDIDVGLAAILSLKPRKFDWKAGRGKDIKGDRGFIAQEFETVFPNLIDEWADPAPEGEAPYKSVRQDLIPVLVKAIQELTARVQTLETR